MLYNDGQKKIFKKVVKKLNYIEIDGESTQHLLQKIGHEENMLRLLIMTMPIDLVVTYFNERVNFERDSDKTIISPIDSNIEHRLKMIIDDINVIQSCVPVSLLNAPTDENDELQQCFNNIRIACDLSNDECLGWTVYTPKEKTIDDKLVEFYREKAKIEECFEYDNISGVCHIATKDSKYSYNATPFWEGTEGIPIEEIYNDTLSNSFVVEWKKPTIDDELEKFKIFYGEIVDMLIRSMIPKN